MLNLFLLDENQALQENNKNQEILTCATTNNLFASLISYISDKDIKVISIGSTNPHNYQPSTLDIANIKNAKFTIINGGHIDEWAQNICLNTCKALDFITKFRKDEHATYSWEAITKTITFIVNQLSILMPENKMKYQERGTLLQSDLDQIFQNKIDNNGVFASNESLAYNLLVSLGVNRIFIYNCDSLKDLSKILKTDIDSFVCFLYNDSYSMNPEIEKLKKQNPDINFVTIKENQDFNDQDPLKHIREVCEQIRLSKNRNK